MCVDQRMREKIEEKQRRGEGKKHGNREIERERDTMSITWSK